MYQHIDLHNDVAIHNKLHQHNLFDNYIKHLTFARECYARHVC